MSDRLDEIEARANAATPGAWERHPIAYRGGCVVSRVPGQPPQDVAITEGHAGSIADADFIAHARFDVPYLLARLRAAEAYIDAVGKGDAGEVATYAVWLAAREARP